MASEKNILRLKQLHERLVDGDHFVANEICEYLLSALSAAVAKRFPRIDNDLLSDCVTDALFEYIKRPTMFDPAKGANLEGFLIFTSIRNIQDFSKKSATYSRKKEAYSEFLQIFVANDGLESNIGMSDSEIEEKSAELMSLLKSPEDQKFFEAQLNGEKDLKVFAKILGISNATTEKQKAEVKRVRDRITKTLKRYVETKSR